MPAPKLQDLVGAQMGTPVRCLVEDIKTGVQTRYGMKSLITVAANGRQYEWWMTTAQFQRQFSGIVVGDTIEVVGKLGSQGATLMDATKVEGVPPAAPSGSRTPAEADDLNIRQYETRQNRIALSSILIELVKSGKHDIEACKQLTKELVQWTKNEAEAMYEADANSPL